MDISENPKQYNSSFPKVFLFGDSLTQRGFHDGGWCSMLLETYERKCDFLNRGFSGFTSRISKHIISSQLKDSSYPQGSLFAAIVLLGTNDSVLKDIDDRSVPVDEYKENLKTIISEMEKHGIPKKRILLISPPPIDELEWGKYALQNGFSNSFSNESVAHYAAACTDLSNELKIQNLDLWTELQKMQNWKELFMDGLHFGKEGQQVVFDMVKKELQTILASLPMVYPDWKDIDHIHPEKTLAVYR